jgi:multimeric flavodoxin WrbA
MSALLKTFFDRITDLLKIEKDIGRKLRGKNMAVITSSNGGTLGDSFWLVFKESAEYLGMNYIQGVHTLEDQDNDSIITEFAQSIKSFS